MFLDISHSIFPPTSSVPTVLSLLIPIVHADFCSTNAKSLFVQGKLFHWQPKKNGAKAAIRNSKMIFFLTLTLTFSHDIMSVETKIYSANNKPCEVKNTLAFSQSQLCIFKYVGLVLHTI